MSDDEDNFRSEMKIEKARMHDSGLFTCLASNRFGSDEMKIELLVKGMH